MTKRQRLGIVGALTLVVTAVVVTLVVRSPEGNEVILASGTVEATEADLGFLVPGRLEHIAVREGDRVAVEEDLAWLDRTELLAAKRAAEAQGEAARARLIELEQGFRSEEVAQGRAAVRAAEQRLGDARRELDRTRRLFEGGAVSEQQLEAHETALTLAQSDYEAAIEQLRILETGPRSEQIAAQRSMLAQSRAAVAQAEAVLENALIRAPFHGLITLRHREPGETVPAGAPVLTLMNPADRWIRIYVPEYQVGRLSIGMPAQITADAYDDRSYDGRVVFIADEAEFTPRNVQTTEERVKLVYRVKVQITDDPSLDLKPGLPADVRLDTGER
ncbi:MAG: efflux RND transporter periplasmic adaptor subunit [Gemmatimonadales bacterium]|jgi:HlyD family secretion protein